MHDLIDFFSASGSWSGTAGIPQRAVAHLYVSVLSMGVAAIIAIPAGLWLGHRNRGAALASAVTAEFELPEPYDFGDVLGRMRRRLRPCCVASEIVLAGAVIGGSKLPDYKK